MLLFIIILLTHLYIAWTNNDASNVDSMKYISGWMAYVSSQVCIVHLCVLCIFQRNHAYAGKEKHVLQAGVRYSSHAMHADYLAAGTFPDWSVCSSITCKSNCIAMSTDETELHVAN